MMKYIVKSFAVFKIVTFPKLDNFSIFKDQVALTPPHSSTLAWKIPWMEEPGRLQSMGSQRVEHD